MSKILITAFEPFGLTGAFLRKANASGDVMARLQSSLSADQYDFLTLPVSVKSADMLRRHLDATKPDGVLCLGEYLGLKANTVNLELYAHDSVVTVSPTHTSIVLTSRFAASIAPEKCKSTIGAYHCNNIYKTALQWSRANDDAPTAFMHVAVLGDRDSQSAEVMKVVRAMDRFVQTSPARNADRYAGLTPDFTP